MKRREGRAVMAARDTRSIKRFLEQLNHVTIAVIDDVGKPWAVPVGVQSYRGGKIEWFSKLKTSHSRAIDRRNEVMLMAFTAKDDVFGEFGFYARARAQKILTLPGIGRYRAEIYEAWYTDSRYKKIVIDIEDL